MKRRRNYLKRTDSFMRWYCRKLTEKQRRAVVATAFALFMASCLYMIASSFTGFGKPDGRLEIEHIRSPRQMLDGNKKNENNHFKDYYDYGYPKNQDTIRLIS